MARQQLGPAPVDSVDTARLGDLAGDIIPLWRPIYVGFNTSAQSLNPSAWTRLLMNTDQYMAPGIQVVSTSGTVVTLPANAGWNGIVRVSVSAVFSSSRGTLRGLRSIMNGAELSGDLRAYAANPNNRFAMTTPYYFNDGSTSSAISVDAYHNHTAAINTGPSVAATRLSIDFAALA